jgi:hypothetical protein
MCPQLFALPFKLGESVHGVIGIKGDLGRSYSEPQSQLSVGLNQERDGSRRFGLPAVDKV